MTTEARTVERAAHVVMRKGTTDLLPPRAHECLSPSKQRELAQRVANDVVLRDARPTPAVRVARSKIGGTRQVFILTFPDLVVWQALGDLARPAVERAVGPRDSRLDRDKWASFDHDALRSDPRYVVLADVASFYDSVDHEQLVGVLASCRVPTVVTQVLPTFLRGVMGQHDALPSDNLASDFFASVLMAPVDRAMASDRWTYQRLCDDFRVGAPDRPAAEVALDRLRAELAEFGMTLAEAKTEILSVADYRSRLIEPRAVLRRELLHGIVGRLVRMRPDRALRVVLRDRMAALDLDACVRMIMRELDRPDDEKVRWPNDIGNIRLEWSLRALTAARNPIGLGLAPRVYERFPFLVPTLPRYLRAVAELPNGREAVDVVEQMLESPTFTDPAQRAWLYFAARGSVSPPSSLVALAAAATNDPLLMPLERVEAARFAVTAGAIDPDALDGLRDAVPPHFRVELEEVADGIATHSRLIPPA